LIKYVQTKKHCSDEVKPPHFFQKLEAFGWWVGFDLAGFRHQYILEPVA
jgi:hypothetical protein